MNKQALQLTSRFSYSPNVLHYCGEPSANQAFIDCIVEGKCDLVTEESKQFIVLWPYLKTIGEILDMDPFSSEVIEAYWLGSKLLDQVKPEHYSVLLKNLKAQGVPNFLIDEMAEKQPKAFIPIHLFNILHVGVGKASGSVPFNLESINNCMIRWGKIIKLDKEKHLATIRLSSLKLVRDKYKFTNKTETHPYFPEWFENLQAGQSAVVHWKLVSKVLTTTEETNLAHHTTRLINSI